MFQGEIELQSAEAKQASSTKGFPCFAVPVSTDSPHLCLTGVAAALQEKFMFTVLLDLIHIVQKLSFNLRNRIFPLPGRRRRTNENEVKRVLLIKKYQENLQSTTKQREKRTSIHGRPVCEAY